MSEWVTVKIKRQNEVAVARVRIVVPSDTPKESTGHRVMLEWQYEPAEGGMPDAGTNESAAQFEEYLARLSEQNGNSSLMLVVTGMGRKQWVYYAREVSVFMSGLNDCLKGHGRYPIVINHLPDPDWEYWWSFAGKVNPKG